MNIPPYFTTKKGKLTIITLLLMLLIVARKIENAPVKVYPTVTTHPQSDTLSATNSATTVKGETARVTRVIDGDTIEIEGGNRVRYIGVDTPEMTGDPMRRCFSIEARDKNRKLVEGKLVRLVKDVSETDRYGRVLRYVYINDIFINEQLVKEGYAHAVSFPPDIANQEILMNAEEEARENNAGLWNKCAQ